MRFVALASLLCVALAAGCGDDEPPQEVSTTIAPPDPSHVPPPAPRYRAHTVNPAEWQPGAPPPPPEPRRQNDIMVTGGMIEAGPLLPRQHTYLRVRNMTDEVHNIEMSGGGDSVAAVVSPRSTVTLEARLGEGTYELTCVVPGHHEYGRFETYEPVKPARPYSAR